MLNLSNKLSSLNTHQKLEELDNRVQMLRQVNTKTNRIPDKRKSKVKIASKEELEALKKNYFSTRESRTELLKGMNVSSAENEPAILDLCADRYRRRVSLKEKLRNMKVEYAKVSAYRRVRGILKAAAKLLALERFVRRKHGEIKKEQLFLTRLNINLHLDVAKSWLLQAFRIFIASVLVTV